MEHVISLISLKEDLKVVALSEIMEPQRAINLQNVVRKELTSSLLVNSQGEWLL